MPELLQKVLTGVLRTFLAPLLVWLVNKDIITSSESGQLVAEVSIYVGIALWSLFAWIKAHRTQLTALAMPKGSTLEQLADKIKSGETAPVATPADATPIITKNLPVILLAIALGALTFSGCATANVAKQPVSLNTPAAVVSAADQDVRAGAMKALGILEATGNLVEKIVDVEAQLKPIIPAALHEQFRTSANALAKQALATIDEIEHGAVMDWPALKAKLDPIIAAAASLANVVQNLPTGTASRFGFNNLVSVLSSVVGQLTTIIHAPQPEGVL